MDATEVIDRAWRLYSAHWRHFFVIAAIIFAAVAAISAVSTSLGLLGSVIELAVSILATFWVWGALVTAVDDVRDGTVDLSVAQTLKSAQERLWPVVLAGLALTLIVMVGLLLIVIPAVIAMTWLFAVIPATVLERRGLSSAISRSIDLVRGRAWQVFVLLLLTVLIYLVATAVLGLVLGGVGLPIWLSTAIRSVAVSSFLVPFMICALTLGYVALVEDYVPPPEPISPDADSAHGDRSTEPPSAPTDDA